MAATASLAVPAVSTSATTEYFDVLNEIGAKTGIVKARHHVHRDGTNTCYVVHMTVALCVGRRVTSFCPIRYHGRLKPRKVPLQTCYAGDWHRAVHVWIYAQSTHRLLIQKRAECKESWPNLWDISAAGHGAALYRQNCGRLLCISKTLLLNHVFLHYSDSWRPVP